MFSSDNNVCNMLLHCLVNSAPVIFVLAQITNLQLSEWLHIEMGWGGVWMYLKKKKKTGYPFVHGDNIKGSIPGNNKNIRLFPQLRA